MAHKVNLAELKEFLHLADACAVQAIKYLEEGFTPDQITEIFARLFTDQFKIHLSDEALAKIPRGGNGQPVLDRESAANAFSLEFASAFMKAVTSRYKNTPSNPA